MHKTHENCPAVQGGEVIAAIDARQMNFRTHAPRLVEVEPSLVKPTEVVNHSNLKLKRIVALQIEALVALHGIRGRMSLGERIARKRLNLPPKLLHQVIGIAFGLAVVEETLRHHFKLRLVAHLVTHHTTQHVGLS